MLAIVGLATRKTKWK